VTDSQERPSDWSSCLQQVSKQNTISILLFQNINHNSHNITQYVPVTNLSTHLHNLHIYATTAIHFSQCTCYNMIQYSNLLICSLVHSHEIVPATGGSNTCQISHTMLKTCHNSEFLQHSIILRNMLQNTLGTKKLQIYWQNGSHKKPI
jgi:hypothetical protein